MIVENQAMKIKSFIVGGLAALSLGLFAAACNENPTDNPPTTGGLNGVDSLYATSLSASSVGLRWRGLDTGAVTYSISYQLQSGGTPTTVTSSTTSTTISGLQTGQVYTFSVSSVRSGSTSSAATINWAAAPRGASTVKMYEFASANPSGLSLTMSGAPVAVSMKATVPGLAQITMFIYGSGSVPDSVIVGPAYAFPEYGASANFDPNKVDSSTYISASAYAVPSLSEWYLNTSLNNLIQSLSNTSAYKFTPSVYGNSQGFVVRYGNTASNYHYARIVIVKGSNGSIVQGTSPNRYIEAEVSLQNSSTAPYAKSGISYNYPVTVHAQRMR
jgi:hypothetical protein